MTPLPEKKGKRKKELEHICNSGEATERRKIKCKD